MKISLLIKRDREFGVIVEKTLQDYFLEVENKSVDICWYRRSIYNRVWPWREREAFLCNPHLNVLFEANSAEYAYLLAMRWYGTGRTVASTVCRVAYIRAAMSRLLRSLLASYALEIVPRPSSIEQKVIIGGNSRLRIFDRDKHEVICILKNGFDRSFLENDISIRSKYRWLPTPRILSIGKSGRSYVEALIDAKSIDTVNDMKLRESIIQVTLGYINRLMMESSESKSIKSYLEERLGRCRELAESLESRGKSIGRAVRELVCSLKSEISTVTIPEEKTVSIGLTHGDLALGNILYNGTDIYIIDWERAGLRGQGFDAVTLAVSSRSSSIGLISKARSVGKCDNEREDIATIYAASAIKGEDELETEAKLLVYLLDELAFHLEENCCEAVESTTVGLAAIVQELGGYSFYGRK